MWFRIHLGAIALACGIGAAVLLPSSAAAVHACHPPHHIANDSNPNLSDITARRKLSCRAARAAVRQGSITSDGGFDTPGFSCRKRHTYKAGGTINGADLACRAGRKRFRFSWAT